MANDSDSFVSRWARRKEQARKGVAPEADRAPAPAVKQNAPLLPAVTPVDSAPEGVAPPNMAPTTEPSPTMDDVDQLSHESDYSRFVGQGVDLGVKRAAMKKLFSDPHFNLMDGLDIYIDDYGKPDPIPLSMLRQMNQSKFLGLFDDEENLKPPADLDAVQDESPSRATAEPAQAPQVTTEDKLHDDPDLQLQQHDGAGRTGAGEGTGV